MTLLVVGSLGSTVQGVPFRGRVKGLLVDHCKRDCSQLKAEIQSNQRVESWTIEQLKTSEAGGEKTNGSKQMELWEDLTNRARCATYSFMSSMFMSKLSKKLKPLAEELVIYDPVDNVMLVSEALQGSEMLMESVSFLGDPSPLELQELDVILGMDFLYAHFASMDFHKKEKLRPEVVLVAKDYLDVFPEELSGWPHDREMAFPIELLPRTTPISQAHYRVALRKLSELKKLQGLVDTGYIRPSISPWRAPILSVKKKDDTLSVLQDCLEVRLSLVKG
ncbi:DNA/RNA polymerases superfamily protein [Cucumis melo var. makuwa]|uniref:DNA/RNA polymerases superfamily protein n=1 Tax=Cucumis melo var. makuwa TaxID=1194695 RepID=A0A5A7U053_CUCMM|nr:DNA/RNA polymerases superfamily protein [Cucumis melo var. makuwa]TYK31553.1 DNA/RNA polymerases superfamily protein [Cucumis melo var. makuwa]